MRRFQKIILSIVRFLKLTCLLLILLIYSCIRTHRVTATAMAMLRALAFATLVPGVLGNHNSVGGTPLMGWSGYNAFMQNSGHCDKAGAGGYNETTFVQTAEALISSGLADLGYVYLNLDDCWIAENRTANGKLTWSMDRFPHGMPWLAKQAQSRKLKLGLYAAASLETYRARDANSGGPRGPPPVPLVSRLHKIPILSNFYRV